MKIFAVFVFSVLFFSITRAQIADSITKQISLVQSKIKRYNDPALFAGQDRTRLIVCRQGRITYDFGCDFKSLISGSESEFYKIYYPAKSGKRIRIKSLIIKTADTIYFSRRNFRHRKDTFFLDSKFKKLRDLQPDTAFLRQWRDATITYRKELIASGTILKNVSKAIRSRKFLNELSGSKASSGNRNIWRSNRKILKAQDRELLQEIRTLRIKAWMIRYSLKRKRLFIRYQKQ